MLPRSRYLLISCWIWETVHVVAREGRCSAEIAVLQTHRAACGRRLRPEPGLGTERSQFGVTSPRPPLLPWVYLGFPPLAVHGAEQG